MKWASFIIFGLVVVLMLPSVTVAQESTGSIQGQIRVEGDIPRADGKEGLEGSVYWLTIIPKSEEDRLVANERLSVDAAKSYQVKAEDGFFRKDGLPPGTYIVAFVFDVSVAAKESSRTLQLDNLGGTVTNWPAEEVEVIAGRTTEVNFTRAPYPQLPDGWVFPHASRDGTAPDADVPEVSPHATEIHVSGATLPYRELGIGLISAGFFAVLVIVLKLWRSDHALNRSSEA